MKKIFLILSLLLLFVSCSSKIPVEIHKNKNLSIDKSKKIIFLEFQNSSVENIKIKEMLKQALINKNYALSSKLYEVDYYVFIHIVSAKSLEMSLAKKSILSNINLNLGLGKTFGSNVGVSTSVGTSLGNIFNKNEKQKVFQIIVDLNIDEYKNNELFKSKENQIVLTSSFNEKKELVLEEIEKKLIKEIEDIF